MTEIQCPACSALLNLSLADPGSDKRIFSEPQQPVIESKARQESLRLAQYNADLASALREFLAVFPWEGHKLSVDIHESFVSWLRGAPEDRGFGKFLYPAPVTKNRVSKLLVAEIGATFIKGPKGREYRLPQSLQPAGGGDTRAGLSVVPEPEVPLTVGGGLVPAARAELAGEGSLAMEGVASLPLAAHVAAVKAQAVAEDAGVDYMFVTKDGVRHKVPLKSRGDVASLVKEEAMQEPADYSLPANLVLDGPSVFPVPVPANLDAPACAVWRFELTEEEAELSAEEQEALFCSRLPGDLVAVDDDAMNLVYDEGGSPWICGRVISLDGAPRDGVVPLPEDVSVVDGSPLGIAEAAAAPLPSSAELAAVAGHEALERARAAGYGPLQPVFLAPEDLDSYEGADPGDWG